MPRFDRPMTRRLLLQAVTDNVVMATSLSASAQARQTASLCRAAERVGLRFGATSDVAFSNAPPAYADLFIRNCDLFASLTPWTLTAPKQTDRDPIWEDPNIAFAREHDLQLTGCHLLWHDSTPSWFEQLPCRLAAEQAVAAHITAITTRYRGMIYSWNVVNEAIEPKDGRPDGLRNSQLLRKLGPEFIAAAFRLARKSAPDALLVYNDWGFEAARTSDEARRSALLRLLDRLLAGNVPIDAVGLQSHLRLDGSADFDAKIYRAFLQEIAGRGLAIIITELDVLDVEFTSSVASRDADVASLYSKFLNVALDEPAVEAVVTWGLDDRYSWYNLWHDRYFKRWDGKPTRPLLFDQAFQPKPAFDAVLSALQHAPPRRNTRQK